jgi:hypothetical protein
MARLQSILVAQGGPVLHARATVSGTLGGKSVTGTAQFTVQ